MFNTRCSFIQAISIAPLQVHYLDSTDTVSEFNAEAPQTIVSKRLAKVSTWRLEFNLVAQNQYSRTLIMVFSGFIAYFAHTEQSELDSACKNMLLGSRKIGRA